MNKLWKHQDLGEFRLEEFGWVTKIADPWEGGFCLQDKEDATENSETTYSSPGGHLEVSIEDNSSGQKSQPETLALQQLELFWKVRRDLPEGLLGYLWEDLQGEHGNRMWWSGIDESRWEETARTPRPRSSSDIRRFLTGPGVTARYFPEDSGESIAINPFTGELLEKPTKPRTPHPAYWALEFAFGCDWEEEHGLAVFWRNGRFIGTDYGYGQGQPADDYQPD